MLRLRRAAPMRARTRGRGRAQQLITPPATPSRALYIQCLIRPLEADVARQAAGPGVVVVCGFGGLARGRDASELLPAIQAAAAAGSGEASDEAVRACWQQVTQRQLGPAIMMHHYPLGDLERYLWTLPGRRMQPLQAQAFIHLLAEALCSVHKTEHAQW
jgi:hypothetical protein